MVHHESINPVALKVLRWDNVILSSSCLLLFRVHDATPEVVTVKDPTTKNQFLSIGDHHETMCGSSPLYYPPFDTLFPLYSFSCNHSNCIQPVFLDALSSEDIFHPDNHKPLLEIIMKNLFSCFRLPTTNPKCVYVIVVEVWRRFVIISLPVSLPDESDLTGTGESSSDNHEEEEEETGRGGKCIRLQEELGESFSDHHEEEETDRGRKRIKLQKELGESSDIIAQEEDESYSETQLWDILLSLRRELRYRKKLGTISSISQADDDQLFQVKSAVRMSTFNGRCRKSEEDDQCSVCLEGYREGQQIVKMPCSHIFHKRCSFEWLPSHGSCPLCRSVCTVSICW